MKYVILPHNACGLLGVKDQVTGLIESSLKENDFINLVFLEILYRSV